MPSARPWIRTALVVASVGALLAVGSRYVSVRPSGKPGAPAPTQTAGLTVPLEAGRLGDVWESDAAVVRVPIRNTTDRAVRVAHLSTDCRARRIEPASCVVPPGGDVVVAVTLDLTDRRPS